MLQKCSELEGELGKQGNFAGMFEGFVDARSGEGHEGGMDMSMAFCGAWELSLRLGHIVARADLLIEVLQTSAVDG